MKFYIPNFIFSFWNPHLWPDGTSKHTLIRFLHIPGSVSINIFMSFCRILSTLCSQVVFHNIPHFGKRAGQKVQRKIAVAVQNVKPLYFLSRSSALSLFPHKNLLSYSICFCNQSDQGAQTEGFEMEGLEMER